MDGGEGTWRMRWWHALEQWIATWPCNSPVLGCGQNPLYFKQVAQLLLICGQVWGPLDRWKEPSDFRIKLIQSSDSASLWPLAIYPLLRGAEFLHLEEKGYSNANIYWGLLPSRYGVSVYHALSHLILTANFIFRVRQFRGRGTKRD